MTDYMTRQQIGYYKKHIDLKLKAENVSVLDEDESINTLNNCVMGSQLLKAYAAMYAKKDSKKK